MPIVPPSLARSLTGIAAPTASRTDSRAITVFPEAKRSDARGGPAAANSACSAPGPPLYRHAIHRISTSGGGAPGGRGGRFRPAFIAGAVLGVLLGSSAEGHFAARTDSLHGFVARSAIVAIGTIRRAERFEERGHTTTPGGVRLVVEEVLAGDLVPGEHGVRIDGLHQPVYAEGERVLVFADRASHSLRSLQSRSEKITADEAGAPVVAMVRRLIGCAKLEAADERACLEQATLEGLRSPVPRIHQDAVVDLLRPSLLDEALDDRDIARLGALARDARSPLVVRQGVTAKLGLLLAGARAAALAPLRKLAAVPDNAAIRVAAVSALGASGERKAATSLRGALGDVDRFVRAAAVEAIARLGAPGAARSLEAVLRDEDARVRYAALKALLRIGDDDSRAALAGFERGADPEGRKALEQALAEIRIAGGMRRTGDIR